MSDAQLTPLQQWLIDVAAQAKQRPWMERDRSGVIYRCAVCGRDQEIVGVGHFDGCGAAAIDAALDKEPK